MNVTKESFNQLAIMHERIKNHRQIKDCTKILRDPSYWLKACGPESQFAWTKDDVIEQLRIILTTPLRFTQLTTHQSTLVTEVCLALIRDIFVAKNIISQDQINLTKQLEHLKIEWHRVNWVITITSGPHVETELIHYFSYLIDDHRFISLLDQVLKKLKQADYPRYQELARAIYFTKQLRFVQNQPNYHVLLDKTRLLFGIESTKTYTQALTERLTSNLHHDDQCRFDHISKPLPYKNYLIQRCRKLKNIRLEVPQHMVNKLAHMFQYGDFHNQNSKARGGLIHKSIPQIYSIYQKELNSISTYFSQTDNVRPLMKFVHFAQLSFIKTIALKQGCTFGQAIFLLKKRQFQPFKLFMRRD